VTLARTSLLVARSFPLSRISPLRLLSWSYSRHAKPSFPSGNSTASLPHGDCFPPGAWRLFSRRSFGFEEELGPPLGKFPPQLIRSFPFGLVPPLLEIGSRSIPFSWGSSKHSPRSRTYSIFAYAGRFSAKTFLFFTLSFSYSHSRCVFFSGSNCFNPWG